MSISKRRLFLLLTGFLGAAVFLAACGSSSNAISATTSNANSKTTIAGNTSGSPSKANFTAYRNCLAQHGVSLPTGRPASNSGFAGFHRSSSGSSGAPAGNHRFSFSSNPKFKAAAAACAKLAPKTGFGFSGHGFSNTASYTAFKDCLQVNGLSPSDLHPAGTKGSLTTAQSKILKKCQALLGKSSSSGSTTTTKA